MKYGRCMDANMFKEAGEYSESNINMNMNMECPMNPMMNMCCPSNVIMCPPIMECPQVKCCHRVVNYEVPHIIPCHTTMVNHHVYRHTYQPCYSYSEEDETSEVYEPNCCR